MAALMMDCHELSTSLREQERLHIVKGMWFVSLQTSVFPRLAG